MCLKEQKTTLWLPVTMNDESTNPATHEQVYREKSRAGKSNSLVIVCDKAVTLTGRAVYTEPRLNIHTHAPTRTSSNAGNRRWLPGQTNAYRYTCVHIH